MMQQNLEVFQIKETPLSLTDIDGFGLEETTGVIDLDDGADSEESSNDDDRALSLDKLFV